MQWYLLEVLPLFLLASVLLWMADRTGALAAMQHALKPVVTALGLPAQTAGMFIFGFFRRDYGAAGLYDLSRQGLLSPAQLAVAGVTLTLFVPCIAQFLMMVRERGVKTAVAMLTFITLFAFGTGFALSGVLRWIW
jgi:ferrous iron transport protein B